MGETIPLRTDWSAASLADGVRALRDAAPRIHCLTNDVAQNLTVNLLLAAGADARLTADPTELGGFIREADAVLINLGMMDDARRRGVEAGVEHATELQKPWALDPTFINSSPSRQAFAQALADQGPAVLRGNPSEIDLLDCRRPGATLRTGARDLISAAGSPEISTAGGHPFMAATTAMGCAGGALTAAYLGAGFSPLEAAVLSSASMKAAGAKAGSVCNGPGTFPNCLIDAIYSLSEADFAAHVTFEFSGEKKDD